MDEARKMRFTATLDANKQAPDVEAETLELFVHRWNLLAIKRAQPMLKIDDGHEEDKSSKHRGVLRQ